MKMYYLQSILYYKHFLINNITTSLFPNAIQKKKAQLHNLRKKSHKYNS